MLLRHVMFAKYLPLAVMGALLAPLAPAASFGRVVTVGGHVSDIALDEPRGVLYTAVYTASRVDVLSLADYSIGRSISVAAYPGALALSPDGRYLVVTHYANFGATAGGSPAPASQNAVTVLNLATNQQQVFGLSAAPLGVAFGNDGQALILTQNEFLLLDPVSGLT